MFLHTCDDSGLVPQHPFGANKIWMENHDSGTRLYPQMTVGSSIRFVRRIQFNEASPILLETKPIIQMTELNP